MSENITITGNLTNDPELRFTPGGDAVANFTVADTERVFDRQANDWKDGNKNFWRCAAWKGTAENVAESLVKGSAVVLVGKVITRNWETKEGEKRSSMEVRVEAIGPDLRRAVAKPIKTNRGAGQPGQQSGQQGGQWGGQQAAGGGGWGGDQGGSWGQQGGGWGGQQGGY
jgi:single-strand DNA-binding protein